MAEECKCAISAIGLIDSYTNVNNNLNSIYVDRNQMVLGIRIERMFKHHIPNVESDCNLNLDEAKHLLDKAMMDIGWQNWSSASENAKNSMRAYYTKLLDCSK